MSDIVLGTGSISKIYYHDQKVAIKRYFDVEKDPDMFKGEVECLQRLQKCPYVVDYISHDK